MPDTSPKPRNVYVDEPLWQWAKQQAKQRGVTVSAVVREALTAAVLVAAVASRNKETSR